MAKTILECGFCGKTQREVSKLVASEKGPCICDECLVVSFAVMIGSPVKFQTRQFSLEALEHLRAALTPSADPGVEKLEDGPAIVGKLGMQIARMSSMLRRVHAEVNKGQGECMICPVCKHRGCTPDCDLRLEVQR